MTNIKIAGVAWWQPEQWDRLKEISEDRNNLEDTYDEWRSNASVSLTEIKETGCHVKKIQLNLEELIFWCNGKGIPVNAASRAEFTAGIVHKRYGETP